MLSKLFVVILTCLGSLRLLSASITGSEDFHVYWKAIQAWKLGTDPYLFGPVDRGFIFKYPPWLLSLFSPFAFLSFESSRLVWGLIQLGMIAYSVSWLFKQKVSSCVLLSSTLIFWWIWLGHFYAGQITLVLLGVSLWALGSVQKSPFKSSLKTSFMLLLLSSKIFTLIPMLGFFKRITRRNVVLCVGILLLLLHAVLVAGSSLEGSESFKQLYFGWLHAAPSGGAALGAKVVRGQGNHSFTAAILRWMEIRADLFHYDVGVCLFLTLFFGLIWRAFSHSLSSAEKWAGWLALGVIVSPLAWHHSFVFAFPLCTLALDQAVRAQKKKIILLAFLGMSCIGLLIPQVIGKELVQPLELIGVKSWGVLFSAAAMLWAKWGFKGQVSDASHF